MVRETEGSSSAGRARSRWWLAGCAGETAVIDLIDGEDIRIILKGAILCVLAAACAGAADPEDELRSRLEGFFEATLNGDVAALEDFVSDQCPRKALFLEQAGALRVLEPVDVTLPEGTLLFDFGGGGVAVAKRARGGPPLLINDTPLPDDPSNDVPLKLERKDGVWRVVNCDAFVPD